MIKEDIVMGVMGFMSTLCGIQEYNDAGHINIMTITMFVCAVGYFTVALIEDK